MKEEEIKPLTISIKITNISLGSFKVAVIDEEQKKNIDNKKFVYEFIISFNLEPNTNSIKLTSIIKIYLDQSKDLYLGEIESTGIFELENYAEIIKEHNGLPNIIITTFGGVLISTTRGFLILKSKDTIVDGALVPLVNTNELFNPFLTKEVKKNAS